MHYILKYSLTVLAVFFLFVLSACGDTPRAEDVTPASEALPSQPTQPAAAQPATEPPPTEPQPAVETTVEPAASLPEATGEAVSPEIPSPDGTESPEVIIFNLSGGPIGFCDTLTIRETGAYLLQACGQEFTGTLDQADLETLQDWRNRLTGFSLSFENEAGEAESLTSELVFKGQGSTKADEAQQQIILDWVNGLLIRSRPQPTPMPTPEAPDIGADGLCPEIERPALLVANYDNPSSLILIDPDSQASCDILLSRPPFGRIMTSAGNIYYPAFDPDSETLTVIELDAAGQRTPLDFTTVSMAQFGPFNFVLSEDGTRIAWTQTTIDFEVDPPVYQSAVWVANLDGSEQRTILEGNENTETRYVELIRFAQDNQTLYYALQPDGLGGSIFSFSGRFDNVYQVPTGGGKAQLLFICPPENGICVGDISPDGRFLTYNQPDQGTVQIIQTSGGVANTLTAPATDFIGPAIFGPTGNIAFVSATLTQSETETEELPRPNPGYLSYIPPPYTGQSQILLSDKNVAAIWEWVDGNRLAYGAMDETGNIGTAIVTVDGQTTQLSPNFALAVLR